MARTPEAGLRGTARPLGELVRGGRRRRAWGGSHRAPLWLALAAVLLTGSLAAQVRDADAAFARGDYPAARAAYERALKADSNNVRALYQIAILDSWDGRLGRSLERFARLRRLQPRDADIMVAEARVLAWADRTAVSSALYDSVLARSPERTDALAGRARNAAWSGDLPRAERLWRDALARHPDEPELLIGLAQTLSWEGQPALGEAYAARARQLAPTDRTALELERDLRAAVRPEVRTTFDGATDSDSNAFVAQEAYYTAPVSAQVRGTLRAGWRRATLNALTGASYGAAGQATATLRGNVAVQAGLGVRQLAPADTSGTTALTLALGLRLRPARYLAAGIGYSRAPFDETALLIRRGFVINAIDGSVELSPSPRWSVSAGGGGAWFSDGNRRYSAVGAVLARVVPGLQLGPFARVMGYRTTPYTGYFAPIRFSVLEGRAIAAWGRARWGVRADGGVGSQQVDLNAARQFEWHLGLGLSRGWGANNEVALQGLVTNSGAAVASGKTPTTAFRYRTLQLRFQQGL
jgi:tetratricopeptide (TPR) repeat protein